MSCVILPSFTQNWAKMVQPLWSPTSVTRYKTDEAKRHATRASDLLPRGGPRWHRAQDVLSAAK